MPRKLLSLIQICSFTRVWIKSFDKKWVITSLTETQYHQQNVGIVLINCASSSISLQDKWFISETRQYIYAISKRSRFHPRTRWHMSLQIKGWSFSSVRVFVWVYCKSLKASFFLPKPSLHIRLTASQSFLLPFCIAYQTERIYFLYFSTISSKRGLYLVQILLVSYSTVTPAIILDRAWRQLLRTECKTIFSNKKYLCF